MRIVLLSLLIFWGVFCTENKQDVMDSRTLSGKISFSNLPPHRGLSVSLAFFEVDDMDSDPPYNGDPPADAVTDSQDLYNKVDLETESAITALDIPFSIEHAPGHFYIQIRTILYRKEQGKFFAQAEQFFYGGRPLPLLEDIPSITFPVEWPSIPLDELGIYGKIEPKNSN